MNIGIGSPQTFREAPVSAYNLIIQTLGLHMQIMTSAFSEDLEISAYFFFMPVQQVLYALSHIDRSQNCS